jgi:hypothetical protein
LFSAKNAALPWSFNLSIEKQRGQDLGSAKGGERGILVVLAMTLVAQIDVRAMNYGISSITSIVPVNECLFVNNLTKE